jgi:UPF0755 protein
MRSNSFTGVLIILALGSASLLLIHFYTILFTPLQRLKASEIVEIPFGTTVQEAAETLHKKGWISSIPAFISLVRATASEGPLQAGEYRLSGNLSPWQILGLLRKGSVILHRVTVPEGLRGTEVAEITTGKLSLSKDRFVALLTDEEWIRSLGLNVPSLEGYLLPETYSFPKNVTEKIVIRKMVEEMLSFFDEDNKKRIESSNMNLHQILTLASIIEKEIGMESEAPLVSSVYHNRLKKKMRLQSDPTVIYGIKDFDGDLRRRDLKQDTPYNTYLRYGLPPTPIANPGRVSILAALYPEETDYLYFVSRNDRTHAFSLTLAEHNRAVNRYQKRRR